MKKSFDEAEGRVLHGLLEEVSGDIVLRIDPAGFVLHASANAAELGMDLSSLLLMPHIADFAAREYASAVHHYASSILDGTIEGGWTEFPLHLSRATDPQWYSMSLRRIDDDDGAPQGAVGLIRSVEHKRRLESELTARAMRDPLTGLDNRHAFCASLRRQLDREGEHAVVLLAIDRMRAIFMQYGQRTADEIQWGFAKYLETMVSTQHGLAQLDGERFGVILPDMSMRRALDWTHDLLSTFAGLAMPSTTRSPELSASAGLAPIEMSVDYTLRQAELGLIMARAGGGMQVATCARASGLIVPTPLARQRA